MRTILNTSFERPIITFIVILLLPSALTFLTLLIHRIRAARAAQRDRAPEWIVHSLPWCIWTGTGWEKHEGLPTKPPSAGTEAHPEDTAADETENADCNPSTSHGLSSNAVHPWFESQVECAICLSEFVKGDRVRILPCHHIFHMDEVDSWLIQRKKLVCLCLDAIGVGALGERSLSFVFAQCPICKADVTKPAPDHRHQNDNPPPAPTERTPLLGQDHEAQP